MPPFLSRGDGSKRQIAGTTVVPERKHFGACRERASNEPIKRRTKRRIERRTALVAALALLLGGCTAPREQGRTAIGGMGGGMLRISGYSDPTSLNPMLTGADIAYQLSGLVLEYLVQLDDRGNVAPVLCEAVPSVNNGGISPDGLTITYHLRHGVHWSDGAEFTSADVIATWKQIENPRNNVVDREGYDEIARIDAPDKYTAVLRLNHPYPPMPTRFLAAIQEAPIPVMPAHVIGKLQELNDAPFSSHPIGTGPFVLQSWVRNGAMTFVANRSYWRGRPALDGIVYEARPSTASELVSLQTGEMDGDLDAGAQRIPAYSRLTGMRMVRSPSLRLFLIDMDTARAPFNDLQVRRAVAYAIDRTSMLARVLHGAGVLADEWLPSWSWAYVAGLPHYDFNPVKAASLLDADGWKLSADGVRVKNGQRLSIVFVGPQGSGDFKAGAELIQSFLKDVGFDVAIKLYPYGIVYDPSGPVKKGNFDLAYYSFSVNYDPSALDYDGCDRFPPRGVNDERYCDPVVDRDERLSLMTNDPARRKALFSDVERRRLLDLASFPLYFVDRVGIVTDRLQNYAPSRGIVPEWNAWRWSLR